MKIILKPDWDITVQIPDKRKKPKIGHFVGRESEIAVLVNELLRKDQGAILVTGYRGVGKTSFAYQALHKVLEQFDTKKVLFVVVNIKQLDSFNRQDAVEPKAILINFIRRLYAVSQEEDLKPKIKSDIETLYKKAVSSEYISVEAYESDEKSLRETERSHEIEFSAQQLNIAQLAWAICFSVALVFQFFPVIGTIHWINKIIPLLFAFPIPFILSLLWRSKKTESHSSTKSNSAKQLYTVDNSVDNLEFDLEKIHRDLRISGVKTLYLLDELDKLEPEFVIQSLKYYKNLFTLSSAMFIFIGDEDLFKLHHLENNLREDINHSYRSLEYTLFTSKYFLSRPTDKELFVFLEEIVDNIKELENNHDFEDFKRLLILEARCDYFDLLQVIRGRISGFHNLSPVIEFSSGNESVIKAKIQKAISVLYYEKYIAYNPSRWIENESVLRVLYNHAVFLTKTPLGSEVNDPEFRPNRSDPITLVQDSALYDFHGLLYKLGYLGLTDYKREINTGSNDQGSALYKKINSKKYHLIGNIPTEVPDKINFLSQLEEQLISEIELLYLFSMNYWNIYAGLQKIPGTGFSQFKQNSLFYTQRMNQWGIKAKSSIEVFDQVYRNLTGTYPTDSYIREDIEAYLKQATETVAEMRSNSHEYFAKIVLDAYSNKGYQILELSQNSRLFSDHSRADSFRQEIITKGIPHKVIANQNFKQQILIFQKIEKSALQLLGKIDDQYFGRKLVVLVESDEGYAKEISSLISSVGGLKLIVLSLYSDTQSLQSGVIELFEKRLKD